MDELRAHSAANCVFITDNAAIHKTEEVSREIIERGHKIVFLPAYSPFLNPIQNSFSKWKNSVKNEEQLNDGNVHAANMITAEDCDGYWRNMFRYLRRALNRE